METSRIQWKECQKFFASGAAVMARSILDLVEVSLQMHVDNKAQFQGWLATGMISKVSDEQATAWLTAEPGIWAVVMSPWVLVQNIHP